MFQQAAAAVASLQAPTTIDHGCVAAMLPHARTTWDVHAMVAWGVLPGGWHPGDGALLTMEDVQLVRDVDMDDGYGYGEGAEAADGDEVYIEGDEDVRGGWDGRGLLASGAEGYNGVYKHHGQQQHGNQQHMQMMMMMKKRKAARRARKKQHTPIAMPSSAMPSSAMASYATATIAPIDDDHEQQYNNHHDGATGVGHTPTQGVDPQERAAMTVGWGMQAVHALSKGLGMGWWGGGVVGVLSAYAIA